MHGLSVLQHSVCMGRVWFRPKSIDDVWRIVWERTKLSRVSCWYNKRRCYQSPFFCPRRFLSLPYLLLLIIPACRLPQPYNNSTRLPMRTPSFVVGKRAARETRGGGVKGWRWRQLITHLQTRRISSFILSAPAEK